MSAYTGFLYGPSGQQIYGTPRESPGKYRPRPVMNREIKRSISQYDHAELVSLSGSLTCRIPTLRAAIRDKNAWAFSNWLPVYHGDNEKWGEAAEEYLIHEVLPQAMFRELREDFAWGMRVSGMGLDMYGDDLAVFTEDEAGNPKIDFIPSPRIGNGLPGVGWVSTMFGGAIMTAMRADGMGIVSDGRFKGYAIYNGVIRKDGRPVAVRILGFNPDGQTMFTDLDLGMAAGTHYACEMEFFGQGRGLPRTAASVLQWMNKEEIDDQFLKGLKNAAERTVIHKLPAGQDAAMARGNAIIQTTQQVPKLDASGNVILDGSGNITTEEQAVFVERSSDGTVTYIGADEDLGGLSYENPHPNVEDFAVRVLMETLSDLGWSWSLIDVSRTGRAPTRLETNKANKSINDRQSIQEARSIRFFQHAIAKGMKRGRIPQNDAGIDAYKWGIGFPAEMSVDQGNDATAALNRLRMGLTNERIEAAKEGYIAKHIRRQREREVKDLMDASDRALKYARSLGHDTYTFDQAMALFYQPGPNPPTPQVTEAGETETKPGKPAKDKKSKAD